MKTAHGYCDCTSSHRHCENQPKIDAIRDEHYRKSKVINDEYLRKMAEIGEPIVSKCSTNIPIVICNTYERGLSVDKSFLLFMIGLLEDKCPECHQAYKNATVLSRSFGPGITTSIECHNCKYVRQLPEYSDI